MNAGMRTGAKTSNDILCERNGLAERVRELEALVATIQREIDMALDTPEISFLVIARIATLVRSTPPAESTTRPIAPRAPLAKPSSPAPVVSLDSESTSGPAPDSQPTLRSAIG